MNPLIGGGWELGFAQMASAARKARMTKKPPLIRPKLALLKWLIVGASLVLSASHPAAALDAVSLQLKWKHQFQFAGYYQALEQGFYRDAGLDVTIREGGPGIDAAEAVASGKADFGVCTASVLRDWTEGRRLEGRPRIHIRIGLNCAHVLVGNVGSSNRLSYTALGDGVNVAARLEGINKQFGTTICISDSIYDQAKADILARPLKRVQVKGRKTEFMIYELLRFAAATIRS